MHILIAPNAFKNSLSASEAAIAINEGLSKSNLKYNSTCFPIGDGGDGTAALLASQLNATKINKEVKDPLGRSVPSFYYLIEKEKTAIIELADASGLRLLNSNERDPINSSSYGTGQLIAYALDAGSNKIILCIGGSASVDGATGILAALGFRFLNSNGLIIEELPLKLKEVYSIDRSQVQEATLKCKFIIMCDVENPLLGNNGAAKIFGPQKGASSADVFFLEESLTHFSFVTKKETGKDVSLVKYGGAAGGVAAGLSAWLNAELVNGIEYFLQITSFNEELIKADLLITGEGRIDDQTLSGKGPFGVAKKAKEYNIPVIGIAGSIQSNMDNSINNYFDMLLPINNRSEDLPTSIKNTKINLVRAATELGNLLYLQNLKM
ncbi:MAG: glycerate kinase [Flavisolibacter sp.]